MQNIVYESDIQNENFVLDSIKEIFTPFIGVNFISNYKNVYASFDFGGFKDNTKIMSVDVKVRDCRATDYPSYFVSKNKGERAEFEQAYMVYFFTSDKLCRVFDLTALMADGPLETQQVSWFHKRLGLPQTDTVFLIPSHKFLNEYYLL